MFWFKKQKVRKNLECQKGLLQWIISLEAQIWYRLMTNTKWIWVPRKYCHEDEMKTNKLKLKMIFKDSVSTDNIYYYQSCK